jgi:hypothetical protein
MGFQGDILMCQAPCVKKLVRRLYWEGPYPFSEFPPWTTEVPEGAICSVATFVRDIIALKLHTDSDILASS